MRRVNVLSYSCSGLSGWIINLFTELKVMNSCLDWVDVNPQNFRLIRKVDDKFDEYEFNLAIENFQLFPAIFFRILNQKKFIFRNDIILVNTSHRLLKEEEKKFDSIVAIRDPRDLMLSIYRYWGGGRSFYDFASEYVKKYVNYYESCLEYENIKIFRFEDRKKDEFAFLQQLLGFLKIEVSETEARQAIELHSVENAKKYDRQIANFLGSNFTHVNSGELSKYKSYDNIEYKKAYDLIIKKSAAVMKKYGYSVEQIYGDKLGKINCVKKIFDNVEDR